MTSTYITTTIPYVNARPHLGFALELVQADVLARYRRSLGEQVRFQAGTDENSLKNVLAAQAAGVGVQEFVDASAAAFTGLAEPLSLSVDDLIRTSTDPRHRAGVERLWRACAARGDLYRKHYEGLYCTGCEQFYTPAELRGRALSRPRHGAGPGGRGELVLPPVPLHRPAARPHRRWRGPRRAGRAPQRGPGPHRRRPAGFLRLPQHPARPRLGHPGPRRPGPGHLRVV